MIKCFDECKTDVMETEPWFVIFPFLHSQYKTVIHHLRKMALRVEVTKQIIKKDGRDENADEWIMGVINCQLI